MNELKELFELITTQAEPDQDSWKEQERRQRRAARNRKLGAIVLAAALIAGAVVFGVANLRTKEDRPPLPADTASPHPSDTSSPQPTDTRSPHGEGLKPPLGLAIVGLDGSVQQHLSLPADAWMPDLSPDGTQIIFFTARISEDLGMCFGCTHGVDRLTIAPVDGTPGDYISFYRDTRVVHNVGRVDLLGDTQEFAFSPDGSRFAFVAVSSDDGNRDIYVGELRDPDANLPEGFNIAYVRRLTFDPAVDEFPAWSPDGSTIFYDNAGAEPLDSDGLSSTQEIWSVPRGGGNPQRLTNNGVADTQADVAADGTVAFWHEGEIWTMDQGGGNQVRLQAVPSGTGFYPRWSPDGTKMALLRYLPNKRASFDSQTGRPAELPLFDVVVVDLSTGEVTVVGPRVAAFNFVSWMPDGSALLINRYDAGP